MGVFSRRSKGFSLYRREHIFRKRVTGLILFLLLLFITFQFVSVCLITPCRARGISMEPTLPEGGRAFAIPLLYGIEIPFTSVRTPGITGPKRGDIVTCTPPTHEKDPWYLVITDSLIRFFTLQKASILPPGDTPWDNRLVIKRIIGIPGDTLRMEDHQVFIKPGGKDYFFSEFDIIQRPYEISSKPLPEGWQPEFPFSGTVGETILGENEYFLLGDNRTASKDSTVWGPVDRSLIHSRISITYLPGFKIR